MRQINYQSLTIVGGSGFIGKSIIHSFNRGLLQKFHINKIYVICRNKFKFKSKQLNLEKINIFYKDISTLNKLPKSDLYIYAAESTNTKFYNKKNYNKIVKLHKQSIINFTKLISKVDNVNILYISSGSVNYIKYKKFLGSYKKLYSDLKVFSEKKIKSLSKFKIKTSIARCYSFIGPHLPVDKHYAIGNFLHGAKYKQKIIINKKNEVIRSYMYSDDMVDWLITILQKSKIKTILYNVGSDESIELYDLAKKIKNLFNYKVIIVKSNNSSKNIDKYVPNIIKTKNDLNLKISYSLIKSLKETLKFI